MLINNTKVMGKLVKSFYAGILVIMTLFNSHCSFGSDEFSKLKLENTDGTILMVESGTVVKIRLRNGDKIKGKLLIFSTDLMMIEGEEIQLLDIQSISVTKGSQEIYLGESATSQNKSFISGLNTAGTSVKSYLLWYTQEIFAGIPESFELKGIFKSKYDRVDGWGFSITSP
jgi:hypothetical protein